MSTKESLIIEVIKKQNMFKKIETNNETSSTKTNNKTYPTKQSLQISHLKVLQYFTKGKIITTIEAISKKQEQSIKNTT